VVARLSVKDVLEILETLELPETLELLPPIRTTLVPEILPTEQGILPGLTQQMGHIPHIQTIA
jgi:hypothetical protein